MEVLRRCSSVTLRVPPHSVRRLDFSTLRLWTMFVCSFRTAFLWVASELLTIDNIHQGTRIDAFPMCQGSSAYPIISDISSDTYLPLSGSITSISMIGRSRSIVGLHRPLRDAPSRGYAVQDIWSVCITDANNSDITITAGVADYDDRGGEEIDERAERVPRELTEVRSV